MRAIYDIVAPAKLNLFLHITGRRPDGYHLLQSVFMLIDWCDTLHLELRTDGRITREDLTTGQSDLPVSHEALPADDLTVRAAKALNIDLTQSFLIGDRWRDVDCGHGAGCRTVFLDRNYSEALKQAPDWTGRSFADAVEVVLQTERAPAGALKSACTGPSRAAS